MSALTGSVTQPLRLPGQYVDLEIGLYQNCWRDYDPALDRYIQADPIGLAGGTNLYGYAYANPVSYVDPEGLAGDTLVDMALIGYDLYRLTTDGPCDVVENLKSLGLIIVGAAIPFVTGLGTIARHGDGVADVLKNGSKRGLPSNPNELLNRGYKETSHPKAAEAGHRTFENPKTGDVLRHDQGKPGARGYEEQDHYHRQNPNSTSKWDQYLDKDGKPCARGCDASHLYPDS